MNKKFLKAFVILTFLIFHSISMKNEESLSKAFLKAQSSTASKATKTTTTSELSSLATKSEAKAKKSSLKTEKTEIKTNEGTALKEKAVSNLKIMSESELQLAEQALLNSQLEAKTKTIALLQSLNGQIPNTGSELVRMTGARLNVVQTVRNIRLKLFCPNHCNNNGYCVSGICICKPNYTGEDCSEVIVTKRCLNECNYRGYCDVEGKCICQEGYMGNDCSYSTIY